MVVFVDHPFPSWWLRCDGCGSEGWLDQFIPSSVLQDVKDDTPASPIITPNGKKEAAIVHRMADMQASTYWMAYHYDLTDEHRTWWNNQGIPDAWQDFWQVGFMPNRRFFVDDKEYTCPAYTIPKFAPDWHITNVDYRLTDPPMNCGKYRGEPGLPSSLFIARPDLSIMDHPWVLIVEGSKKAMVSHLNLHNVFVAGVPAASSWAKVNQLVSGHPRIMVVLDPDAEVAARRLAANLGEHARYLVLPTKIDDAFLRHGLTEKLFWELFRKNKRKANTPHRPPKG